MKNLFQIAGKNKLYVVLAVFLITMNLLAFFVERKVREKDAAGVAEEVTEQAGTAADGPVFDPETIRARERRLTELAAENPLLYLFVGILNLAMIFFVFLGLLLDGYFFGRFIRKRPLSIRTDFQEMPRWDIADIVRVSLIFLSFGYLFVILQASVARFLPIFHNENFRMVFNTAVMNVVGISVILHFVVRKYGQGIKAIGITLKRFGSNVFYAIVGYVSLIPVMVLIMIITFFVIRWLRYEPPVQPIVQVFMEEKATGILWMSTLFAAVFGPVAEEIFFRGFMYSAIRKAFGVFWGMVATSLVFAFLHAHVVGFLPIMALGMLLAYLYEKTGSLVSCASVHILHNVAMLILVFLMRHIGV